MKVNYSIAFKLNGQWTENIAFERPVMAESPLDETLDTSIVVSVSVPQSLRKIPPFTLCRVVVTDAETDEQIGDPHYYFTADRNTEATSCFHGNEGLSAFLAKQYYTSSIPLIELTKILEREPCDSLSFTHKLQANYAPYAAFIDYTSNAYYTEPDSDTPFGTLSDTEFRFHDTELNTFYASPAPSSVFSVQFIPIFAANVTYTNKSYTTLKIIAPDNAVVFNNTIYGASGNTGNYYEGDPDFSSDFGGKTYIKTQDNPATFEEVTFPKTQAGNYTFIYKYRCDASAVFDYVLELSFVIDLEAISAKPIPSITDVINRLLNVGVTRPTYKSAKYKLEGMNNDGTIAPGSIADKFKDVPAPEFFFPRFTLFEGLLEVGKKIHGIPRLTVDENENPCVVTYDLLGLDEDYAIPATAQIVGYKNTQAMNDFCGALDCYAENHINTVDPDAGTITEPFDGGYKTLRCESGVAITNETAVIELTRPIYRIIKVEMAYTVASAEAQEPYLIGDITKFIYEQAEYDGLFVASTASYPNSAAHALVYKQGDRFIRGFDTSSESLLNILQQFKEPAILNIVRKDLGKAMGGEELYGNLAFRVTYIPMDNLRLRQYKPYATHPNGNLLYNQQNANTVEASFFGESLKGKIARMGNEIEIFTIQFASPADLPLMGNVLVDENGDPRGYIFKIVKKADRYDTVADVYVTPDFNRLSEYFSLESNFRLYEVSERQSIDRQVTVSRIIKVSLTSTNPIHEPTLCGGGSWTDGNNFAIKRFLGTFIAGKSNWQTTIGAENNKRATVAVVRLIKGKEEGYEQLGDKCYTFPVNSTACGNSLAFSFGFADSYSAGFRSTKSDYKTVKWKQRKNSPYGGVYGDFWGMEFAIGKTLYTDEDVEYSPTIGDQTTAGGFDDSLPTIENNVFLYTMKASFFSTRSLMEGDEITDEIIANRGIRVIDKNSSEHITMVVQFHGQADDKKIVFGSAMWNNNLLIRDDPVTDGNGNIRIPHVYGLKRGRLNMLRNRIDLSSAEIIDLGAVQNITAITDYRGTLTSVENTSAETFKAWCIADSVTGDIYIGVNESVAPGANTSPIYFNFDMEA